MRASSPHIYLVAAEASGDALGAELAAALHAQAAQIVLSGVGGARMAGQGVESLFDISDLSVLGFVEGIKAYPRVVRRADETAEDIVRAAPDAVVLIDSWGFTLRVAQRVRKRAPHIKLVKYVGPQVWATRPGRARTLADAVDHLLTIHPFDAPLFEDEGLKTSFVGNPALWRGSDSGDGTSFRATHGLAPGDPVLMTLFGSRSAEIERLFEPFEAAAASLAAQQPGLRLIVPVADSIRPLLEPRLAESPALSGAIVVGENDRYDAFAAADAAIACSGTVTSELALAGVPAVVGYRLSPLTHFIAKRLMRAPYISLVNIAANEELMPEFVQDECTGEALCAAARELLGNDALRNEKRRLLRQTALEMKGDGAPPSETAARIILELIA